LPAALLVMMAIFQLALFIVTAMVVQYAAYAGARAGVVHVEDGEYAGAAVQAAKIALGGLSTSRALLSRVGVELEPRRLTVRVSYPSPWLWGSRWIPWRYVTAHCSLVPEIKHRHLWGDQ